MGNDKDYSYVNQDIPMVDLLKEKYPDEPKKSTKKKLIVFGSVLGVGYLIYPHPVIVAVQAVVSIFKGLME